MKKIICLLLALTLVFSLCACGKDNTSDKDDDKEQSDIVGTNDNGGDIDINLKDCEVGDYVTFGSYEQDNNTANGKEEIEWLILDIEDGNALVISKYALDAQPYNTEWTDITWEDCTLRQWLNDDFLNSAFSSSEQKKIQTTTVVAEDNEFWETEGGNNTQDKIFLLSISEAEDYFDSDEARECQATDYAVAEGCRINDYSDYYGNCEWWLRSPGMGQFVAASVDVDGSLSDGAIDGIGGHVSNDFCAVRPALWINLES